MKRLMRKMYKPNPYPEKPRIAIQQKHIRAYDTSRPSIEKLGDDVLTIIFEELQRSHPKSMPNVRLTCSVFNPLAEYLSYSVLKLDLSRNGAAKTKRYLNYIERHGLLPAIRVIRVSAADDECNCSNCAAPGDQEPKKNAVGPAQSVERLRQLLSLMTGLRDIWWPNQSLSHITLDAIQRCPELRLHVNAGWFHLTAHQPLLSRLRGNTSLHSLIAQHEYCVAEECLKMTQPLKEVLLTCPNLRLLTLDIGQPRTGCVVYAPPSEYCGCGFVNGQRPPALERLNLREYPFAWPYMHGYPGNGNEQNYWAEVFDWSRLKFLQVRDASLAILLMPKMKVLEEVVFESGFWDVEKVQQFYNEVPVTLKAITVDNIKSISTEGIVRHGAALRSLQVHQNEGYRKNWSECVIDDESLIRIRNECPLIEDLRLDVARSGEWPKKTLSIFASFPRLRSLTIWFELGMQVDRGVVEPRVTFSAVQMLFQYLREYATSQPPQLQELCMHSGSPPSIGIGFPDALAFWPDYNSMKFVCRLADRDDEAAQGKLTCECPGLNVESNRFLRGERRTEEKRSKEYDFTFESERLRVARDGPMSQSEWHAHY